MDKNYSGAGFILLAVLAAIIPVLGWAAAIHTPDRFSGGGFQVILPAALVLYVALLAGLVYRYGVTRRRARVRMERLEHDLLLRDTQLERILGMADLAGQAPDAEALYLGVMDQAMEAVGVRNGSVFAVDSREPEGLRFVAARPALVLKDGNGSPSRHSFVRTVIETGKTLVVTDIEHDPRTLKSNDPKYGPPSFISIPICNNRKVLAVLNLANKIDGQVFTRHDERVLSIMLGHAGMALEIQALRKTISDQLVQIRDLTARLRA